jgi:hypothetical protein
VPVAGAGRGDFEAIGQPFFFDQIAKNRLGHRRAADVAQAHEEDIDFVLSI